MDDVAALVADAQVRGRIWHEDQADREFWLDDGGVSTEWHWNDINA